MSAASPAVTTAGLLLEALRDVGISVVFANLGSDHPAVIEALAEARERGEHLPTVVLCPHENSALSAAHGLAAATGRPQAVFVHTDVGTANLGGSVHNASRSRVPVFIFSGLTPFTLEGELPGTRNNPVNHLQDVPDQHGIVRPYVKWSYDIRTGRNVKQLVYRALQIATSAPAGPVYLTGAREVLAEAVPRPEVTPALWGPVERQAVAGPHVARIAEALESAERPLIVTSSLGRNPGAVGHLVDVAERLGVPVVEVMREYVNFPSAHPLHLGYAADELVPEADVIVVVDAVSPWIASRFRPAPDARIFYLDEDPLQQDLPLWYMPSSSFLRADSELFLADLAACVAASPVDEDRRRRRAEAAAAIQARQRATWSEHAAADAAAGVLSVDVVAAALERVLDPEDVLVIEAPTSTATVYQQLTRDRPGSLIANGGTSLGWSGGAALGVKIAHPDRTVVSVVGDGSFYFTVPSSTYWIAQQYGLPFLTVILDNSGWNATKQNLRLQHPGGTAERTDRLWVNLGQSADLPAIAAAAGGAWAATVTSREALEAALVEGLAHVATGRSAVVCVRLDPVTRQPAETLTTSRTEHHP